MHAPELEFLPPSRWARWWGHGVLALGLAAAALAALRHGQASDAHAAALARLQPPSAAPQALPRALAAEMAAAQAVAATLALPWDAWFRALESVAVPGVFLTALQPEGHGRRARLTGHATALAPVLAYMEQLQRAPGFGRVLLVDHALEEDGGSAGLRFTLTAEWEAP